MNPYWVDFWHLFRRRVMIVVVVIAVIAGAVTVSQTTAAQSSDTLDGAGGWYYASGAYHVTLWAFDPAGEPVAGIEVQLRVWAPSALPAPIVFLYNQSRTTVANGSVSFTIPLPSDAYDAQTASKFPAIPTANLQGALAATLAFTNSTSPLPSVWGSAFTSVAQNFYSVNSRSLIVWQGASGALPAGDRAVACSFVFDQASPVPFPSNCSGQTTVSTSVLGSIDGYRTLLPSPNLPGPTQRVSYPDLYVAFLEIENASGTILYSVGLASESDCAPCTIYVSPLSTPGPGLLDGFASTFGFFVSVLAVAVAYWSYARPRLSGSLEPVLARPVTRGGLFLTRYGASAFALGIVVVAEVLLFDLWLSRFLLQPLPPEWPLALVGGLSVTALAFVGLVVLSAHGFRSPGSVLGLGIALVLVFSLFWELLISIVVAALDVSYITNASALFYTRSALVAPAQLPGLVVAILAAQPSLGQVYPGAPAALVPGWLAALACALWVALPAGAAYRLAVTRD